MATYVRLDKIKKDAHIDSIVSATDLENGQFVALGDLQPDGEARSAVKSGDVTKELVLHVSSPLVYSDFESELDFVLKAGKVGRAFTLEAGDMISISIAAVNAGVVTKNDLVVPNKSGEIGFEVDASATDGIVGKVVGFDVDANAGRLAVIKFIKA